MRDRGLQGIQTIVQRQKCMTTKRHHRRLFLFAQNCRPRLLRPGLHILNRNSLPPLRHRLWVDAQFFAQFRERSLRSLYCSSDGVRGRGAPVTNLSHSESFHSRERIAPSNRGIKHLNLHGYAQVSGRNGGQFTSGIGRNFDCDVYQGRSGGHLNGNGLMPSMTTAMRVTNTPAMVTKMATLISSGVSTTGRVIRNNEKAKPHKSGTSA